MTRKQAILRASDLIGQLPANEETKAVAETLQELASDLPITTWDEKTVFDTVEQFFLITDDILTQRNLKAKDSHPTQQLPIVLE